jgi:GT2 family glycosyltransferase
MIPTPSAAAPLPDGLSQVLIADGAILVQATRALAEAGLSVKTGDDVARLMLVEPEMTQTGALPQDHRPAFEPSQMVADGAGAETAEVTLNTNKQWSLPGLPTVQVKVTPPASAVTLPLAARITVPAHAKPLAFRVGLGVHRATGHVQITRYRGDDAPQSADRAEFAFDADKLGGHDKSDFLEIEHRLSPCATDSEIELTLVHENHAGDDPDRPSFYFIADPHVGTMDLDMGAVPVFQMQGTSPGADAVWLRSELPGLFDKGADLSLILDDKTVPLTQATTAEVVLEQDHGHSMSLSASAPGLYRIVIDGAEAFEQNLGPEARWVRMPVSCQTGHYRRLSVYSQDGTRLLMSTFTLMPRLLTPAHVLQTESRAPFPGPLMSQASHRYDGLKAHMAAGVPAAAQADIAQALTVLEGGHDNVKLTPLTFPEVEAPDVTVVIPAHNKIEVTYLALASLLVAHNDASFEVIVVDDASTDETAELETIVSGITVIHNAQAQRFIRSCNLGAARARGRYVALLNNDVEVTAGWLDALIDAFGRFDKVGLVGSKLLYPDGKLQDAGGIIWGTGNPWNYGNGENPWDPRFCYARQADYLSGAAMMTTKAIWDEVGGLSSYLEPMYFEDTDFAFKVRAAGYSTWFVPSSVVYHYEGMTSGTDSATGFKRFQEVNRPKFKRRWAADYARFGAQGVAPDLEKDRGIVGRVLFIDYAVPRPDRDAGSHAAIQEIRLVQSLGYKVTFLPRNLAHMGVYTEELERMGVEVIYAPFFMSLEDYLDQHATDFDAFFITRFYVARDVLGRLKRLAPDTKILFNNADLHFLRELRAGIATGDAQMLAKARETRTLELEVMRQVDVVLSYNEVEHSVIQSHTDGAVQVVKCPWVVDLPPEVPPLETRTGLSFLGNYKHTPNAEAVLWFTGQVMPALEVAYPDLVFTVYGSAMPDEIKALESETIAPEGFVENIADAYDRHRIFVAPLLSGAGIKGKVLAALAHGVPCVLTPTAAEGIGVRAGHDCLIAETATEWRDAIARLMQDDALWAEMSANARGYVKETFSFRTGRDLMRVAFESVDLYSPVA